MCSTLQPSTLAHKCLAALVAVLEKLEAVAFALRFVIDFYLMVGDRASNPYLMTIYLLDLCYVHESAFHFLILTIFCSDDVSTMSSLSSAPTLDHLIEEEEVAPIV